MSSGIFIIENDRKIKPIWLPCSWCGEGIREQGVELTGILKHDDADDADDADEKPVELVYIYHEACIDELTEHVDPVGSVECFGEPIERR